MNDGALVMQAMTGPQERLTKADNDRLLEFFLKLQTGETLSGRQRATLHEITRKVFGRSPLATNGLVPRRRVRA